MCFDCIPINDSCFPWHNWVKVLINRFKMAGTVVKNKKNKSKTEIYLC